MANLQGYRKLNLYQKSKELVLLTYKATRKFPKEEQYVLVPQIRRATISVLANIVEGYSKDSSKDYARFLTISIGSLFELEVYLELCLDLGYINKTFLDKMNPVLLETKKLLFGTRKALRKRM